jgi:3-phenylpropionate/cinnamic acid dioxygenase small subunit
MSWQDRNASLHATTAGRLDRAAVEDFLFWEAQLLDERRFEEWLQLFAADCVYTIPSSAGGGPEGDVFIVYDDRSGLEERVWRMRHPAMHAQIPPSETVHLVGNVKLVDAEGDEAPGLAARTQRVRSTFVLYEVRLGEQRSFAGRCEHVLRSDEDGWKIALKKIHLVNRGTPLRNLTFFI